RVRDPLDRGGGLPLDSRRRDVRTARPDHRRGRDRPTTAADDRDARGAAVLRARDDGARGARPRPRGRAREARRRGGGMTATAAAESARGGGLARHARRRAGEWLPPVLVFAIGVAAWEWIFSPLAGKFLLPRPSLIARALWDNHHLLLSAGWYT